MKANKEKTKKVWLKTAVRELVEIMNRWTSEYGINLSSFRQMEKLLEMNDRTLRKLNPDHPDDSLSLDSVINMYVRLFIVSESCLNDREKSQELLLLQKSFLKVYVCTGKIPPGMAERAAGKIAADVNIA